MRDKAEFRYYTLGDFGDVTVCLMTQGDNLSRGLAIRSIKDDPDFREGEEHSRKYARMAMGGAKKIDPIKNKWAKRVLRQQNCPFVLRGERNPRLTWVEMAMLGIQDPYHFVRLGGVLRPRRAHVTIDDPVFKFIPGDPLKKCPNLSDHPRRAKPWTAHPGPPLRTCTPKGLLRRFEKGRGLPREFCLGEGERIQRIKKITELNKPPVFYVETNRREMLIKC